MLNSIEDFLQVQEKNSINHAFINIKHNSLVIAELRRAKRASKAPWVKENGNSSSRENLVMTSAYGRTSERPSVQTLGEEEGHITKLRAY